MTATATTTPVTTHMPRQEFDQGLRAAIARESDLTMEEFVKLGRRGELEGALHDLWLMVAPLFR
ncbi:hypothetical protein BH24ACT15_BH24ACT15_24600 [soil metagenome]|jgi:hypothetical protein